MPSEQTVDRYLSIADLSRLLGLPESTTRYYCKRFAEHLPHMGEGRKRRYAPESEGILRTVMEEMRRSKNAFAVDLVLNKATAGESVEPSAGEAACDTAPASTEGECGEAAIVPADGQQPVQAAAHGVMPAAAFPANGDIAVFSSQVMTMMERQTQALQEIASAMTLFASHHPAAAREDTERLREDLTSLKEDIRLSEERQSKDLEQTRKWLARFSEALAKR
ncbi:helix-turn-helix domain-containing protein [Desulfovibrio sp. OttesenSCG-928-I05]|nr:helix-turn-helix domain-containing protein [Desulfovibrio sp. OttesenSCG-928-I05]